MAVTVQVPVEKAAGAIREVTLGATAADGGTRTSTVTVGGERALPFLHFDAPVPHRPVVAVEIHDQNPVDWASHLRDTWGDVLSDPAEWAKVAVQAGADLIVTGSAVFDGKAAAANATFMLAASRGSARPR